MTSRTILIFIPILLFFAALAVTAVWTERRRSREKEKQRFADEYFLGSRSLSGVVLAMKRSAVREAVGRFRAANPRVFGSVLHGTDRDGSDLDLLVDALPGATLLDLGDLEEELKSLLGVDVDLLTPGDLPPKFRAKVLAEAQPI